MLTFLSRLGRIPVLIVTGIIALILFGLLLAVRPDSPAPNAQTPSVMPPTVVADMAVQPILSTTDPVEPPAPTNTLPPTRPAAANSPVADAPPAVVSTATTSANDVADPISNTAPTSTARVATTGTIQPSIGDQSSTPATQPTQADPAERYIDVAQRAAPPRQGQRPSSDWEARVIDDDQGHAVMVIMPLDGNANTAAFVRTAKERIAAIVNALFLDDPQIIRVGVIGTFPNQRGAEVPAISLIVNKAASPRWGQVSPSELERIAQSITVAEQFRP